MFANVASGSRLTTSDSSGSFLVTYTGTNLVLSDFMVAGSGLTSATWTGSDGNWSDATKWDSNPLYPNNGQPSPTSLYDATLANGSTITLDLPVTIQKLALSAGTITGPHGLTTAELFTWGGGTLSGSGANNANGGILLSGGQLFLTGRTLNLPASETATFTGPNTNLSFGSGATFNSSGTFLAQNNQGFSSGTGGGTFDNSGIFTRASSGGAFTIASGVAFNNSGAVRAETGTLVFNGGYTQTAGSLELLGGNVQSATALDLQGGLLTGAGAITASLINNATIRPGLSAGGLVVTGNVSLLSSSTLVFNLGGITQGSQYGFLNVSGQVSLGGTLAASFVNGFQNSVSNGNVFTLLQAGAPFTGAYNNVAAGGRLSTTDNFGSFLVTYSGNQLQLSDFLPTVTSTVTSHWNNPTSGPWTSAANWSSNPHFPNNGQPTMGTGYDVVIDASGSAYTVALASPVVIQNLTLNSPNATLSLDSGAILRVRGASILQGGALRLNGGALRDGTLTLSGGNLLITTSGNNRLDNVVVNGTLHLSENSAFLRLQNGSSFTQADLTGANSCLLYTSPSPRDRG
jgi:hypothetical protein